MTTYLLRDTFTTTEGAPLASPRTCEPGPGTLVLTDTATGADASISGSKYLRPRPTGNQGYANYGCVSSTAFTRVNGLMAYTIAQSSNISGVLPIAFHSSSALIQATLGGLVQFGSTSGPAVGPAAGAVIQAGSSLTINVDYQVAIVCRGNGNLFLIRGGSQFPNWNLLYVTHLGLAPVLYVLSANFNSDLKTDVVSVLAKTGNLALEYGKTLYFDAMPVSGDFVAGAGDALEYFTWTPAAGETLSLFFRRSTDDECYRLDCAQAGGTIKLYRRTGGVDTELNSGKTQTWTVGTPYRIGIVHAAGEISTFTETTLGAVGKHVVTGETFNLTTTGAKVSGFVAGANFEIWPRTFTGTDETDIA